MRSARTESRHILSGSTSSQMPRSSTAANTPVTITHAGSDVDTALRSWVRFTFVTREAVRAQAVAGLHRLHRG